MKHLENNKCVCLYGEAGIGKTTMAYIIGERLGATVREFNASNERTKNDVARIMRFIRIETINPQLFLFDEVDSFKNWKALIQILSIRRHKVIMTANDLWKIPDSVKKNKKADFQAVRLYPPKQSEVSQALKDQGFTSGFTIINFDFRDSKNAMLIGGSTHKTLSSFDITKKMMTNSLETIPELIKKDRYKFFSIMRAGKNGFSTINKDSYLIWLLDNVFKFYTGKDIFDAIQKIAKADLLYKPELLQFLPRGRGKKIDYPYFLKQLKVHGKGSK